MATSIDKLLDYMFDQNSKLTDKIAAVCEELRLQREQSDLHHRDLKSSLARMEERAVAAERRADAEAKRAAMESEAREKAEKRIEELLGTIDSLMDGSTMLALQQQIIDLTRQRDDAKASDKHNRAERYGRTSQKIKDSASSEADDNDRDAEEEKKDMGGKDSVDPLPEDEEGL